MISIIIPVYNTEHYLVKCLDSCFAQSYSDIEVVAVNDGSSDNCGAILDAYAEREPRLKVLHQSNQGVVKARNEGVKSAKGQWLMFVDADDFIEANAVKVLYKAAVGANAQVSIGELQNVDEIGNCCKKSILPSSLIEDKKELAKMFLTEKLPFSLCGKLFRQELVRDSHTIEELRIGEDAYVTIQLCNVSQKVVVVNQVVYNYLQRMSSVSHRPSEKAINSIIYFIEAMLKYYRGQLYGKDEDFVQSLNYFVLKEYFTYLRMGGRYINNPIQEKVNVMCLNDAIACQATPRWRIMMLKIYRFSPFLGNIYRYCFVKLRSLLR